MGRQGPDLDPLHARRSTVIGKTYGNMYCLFSRAGQASECSFVGILTPPFDLLSRESLRKMLFTAPALLSGGFMHTKSFLIFLQVFLLVISVSCNKMKKADDAAITTDVKAKMFSEPALKAAS